MHLSPGARTFSPSSELARKLERKAADNQAARDAKQRDMQAQWARQLAEMRSRDVAIERAARRCARAREVKRLLHLHRLVEAFPAIARGRVSSRSIVAEVAAQHGITYADMVGHSRKRAIVLARREAIYRLRTETPLSMAQIGKALGGKDHTSVLHALRCHVEARHPDPGTEEA
jgi:chromosomal replication initiation ATPase DnaA